MGEKLSSIRQWLARGRARSDGTWRPSDTVLARWLKIADDMDARARLWSVEPGGQGAAPPILRVLIGASWVDATRPDARHAREAWERASRELRAAHERVRMAVATGEARHWEVARIAAICAYEAMGVAEQRDVQVMLGQAGYQ